MKLTNEFEPIRIWAAARGILQKGTSESQMEKLEEEWNELLEAEVKNDTDGIKDAIGDMVVVLTNLAYFHKTTIEECINGAYEEIVYRKGAMIAGTFVKYPHPTCNPSCFSICTSNHQHEPKCKTNKLTTQNTTEAKIIHMKPLR